MKYAIVDGQRLEALPRLRGKCPVCDVILTPKCGKIRVPHWAHPPGIVDHRWEPETEWHRNWKNCFPVECQEIVHRASSGERHIADVKTGHGRVLEIQHSSISDQERRSREEFYRPMYWIVNGLRLRRDRSQFFESLRCGGLVRGRPWTLVAPIGKCELLRKWADSRVHVFFDFGEGEHESDNYRLGAPVLWALVPGTSKGIAVLKPVYRENFVEAMLKGEYPRGIVSPNVFQRRAIVPQVIPLEPHIRMRQSFVHFMARKSRARRRRRF